MRKKYILDTSTLICDPAAYKHFTDSDIIIPVTVLNELDNLKKQAGEAGKHARVAIRLLDEIADKGDISTGILLDNDILLKIDCTYHDPNNSSYSGFGNPTYADTQILILCYDYYINKHDVVLVSNDINLRVKAKSRGLEAISHERDGFSLSDLYSGMRTLVDEDAGMALQKSGYIDAKFYGFNDLNPNECVMFESEFGDGIAMGRKTTGDKIKLIKKVNPWNIHSRNKEQSFAIDLIMDKNVDLVTLIGRAGTGKSLIVLATALELVINRKEYDKFVIYRPIQPVGNDIGFLPGPQPLDAKILTPDGWTTMGELKSEDYIISRDGNPTKVLGVYPKGTKSIYKITTSDGTSTECCADHLWFTQTDKEKIKNIKGSIKNTKELMTSLNDNHRLPRPDPINFSKKELPIPPYSFGVYLGDGSSDSHLTYYTKDQEIINKVETELKSFNCYFQHSKTNKLSYRVYPNFPTGKKGAQNVEITNLKTNEVTIFNSIGAAAKKLNKTPSTISKYCRKNKPVNNYLYKYIDNKMSSSHPILSHLHSLNLNSKRAWDKFIPDIYKYSSIEDRVALLQGLMDTDGTIKKTTGEMSYATTSKQLACDIIEIVRSLGGKATLCERNRVGKCNIIKNTEKKVIARRVSYEFTISLPNSINPFFLSRKHNLVKERNINNIYIKKIEYVGEKAAQCILVDNPEHLYITNDFIVTHNTMEEKLGPWFQAIMDNMETLLQFKNGDHWKRELEHFQKKGLIEMETITYIRGRSISNSIILIDECQNLSKDEVKTILTRAGENTKIILTGDISQIDNFNLDATNNGLVHAIEKFKDSNLAGHITFTQGERSRLASKAAEIL